ncbi:methyltransferase domain-containing protein, partial [bacterium]|nr:methyltransferase domain-containing protein [bacterium]
PLLYRLMSAFRERTGCPVMVNTSFNLGWEPIVRTPKEAYATFQSSGLDLLCIGPFVLRKSAQRATVTSPPTPERDEVLDAVLRSPCCGDALTRDGDTLACASCRQSYPVAGGIPQLFRAHDGVGSGGDVDEVLKALHEETPFPSYNEHGSVRSLMEKFRRNPYARRLDETIPYNTTVLDVGCGTGQLANFLGMSCRRVVGTDSSLRLLQLGEAFRTEHALDRVRFVQMNLFYPALAPGSFDVVICSGVLHGTGDPLGGFRQLCRLVRPGGHVVVGLPNRYGRLDPALRSPHGSKHTFGEIQGWFEEVGLAFVRGVPAMRPEDDGLEGAHLFEPQPRGTRLTRGLVQAMEMFAAGHRGGGGFVMIGCRPEEAGDDTGAEAAGKEGSAWR